MKTTAFLSAPLPPPHTHTLARAGSRTHAHTRDAHAQNQRRHKARGSGLGRRHHCEELNYCVIVLTCAPFWGAHVMKTTASLSAAPPNLHRAHRWRRDAPLGELLARLYDLHRAHPPQPRHTSPTIPVGISLAPSHLASSAGQRRRVDETAGQQRRRGPGKTRQGGRHTGSPNDGARRAGRVQRQRQRE